MFEFAHQSIQRKLMGVIMLIATLTLVIAFAIFALVDMFQFREELVQDLTSVTEILGANSTAALAFGDPEAAAETLSSLRDKSHILMACLYDQEGAVFAEYASSSSTATIDWPPPQARGHHFERGRLSLFTPVRLEGRPVGTVYLQASLAPMYVRLGNQGRIAGLVMLVATAVAFGLTSRLQRVVSAPIQELAATARTVTDDKDYSVRATQRSEDEIGLLIGTFNEMLTEIESRDEALRRSEQHFRSLIEHASDLITVLDAEGNLLYVSPSAARLLGRDASSLTGQSLFTFVHPDDLAQAHALLEPPRDAVETIPSVEFRFGSEKGAWIVLDSVASNLLHDPAVVGIVVNSRDVTERREADEKLAAFARNLERSNRELQDFAYVASHDLQEPLRKIRAFGERLQIKYGEVLEGRGLEYLDRMGNAAERMQALIASLLDFSRVTSKAQPFVPVDLNQVAREVLGDLEIRVEEVGASVEVAELATLDADPTQMRQLLQNLIGNALKFRREGVPPLIRVSGASVPSLNGARYQLQVEDNGIGMEKKYQDRIFGIFQRLHGRDEYEGTGVGLSICRKIADRHNGDIEVQSTPGSGTTFIVTLPKHQEQGALAA